MDDALREHMVGGLSRGGAQMDDALREHKQFLGTETEHLALIVDGKALLSIMVCLTYPYPSSVQCEGVEAMRGRSVEAMRGRNPEP